MRDPKKQPKSMAGSRRCCEIDHPKGTAGALDSTALHQPCSSHPSPSPGELSWCLPEPWEQPSPALLLDAMVAPLLQVYSSSCTASLCRIPRRGWLLPALVQHQKGCAAHEEAPPGCRPHHGFPCLWLPGAVTLLLTKSG